MSHRRSGDHHIVFAMDPEAFLDMANQIIKLKMFPYFDIAYCVLCALHVREDLGPGKLGSVRPFLNLQCSRRCNFLGSSCLFLSIFLQQSFAVYSLRNNLALSPDCPRTSHRDVLYLRMCVLCSHGALPSRRLLVEFFPRSDTV